MITNQSEVYVKAEVKNLKNCVVEIEMTIDAQEAMNEYNKVFNTYKTKMQVPGFRPGKAPASTLERYFGATLRQEFLEKSLDKYYKQVLDEHNIHPISEGKPIEIKWEKTEDLYIKIHCEITPAVNIEKYYDLEVVFTPKTVSDTDIESRIDYLKNEMKTVESIDAPVETGFNVSLSMNIIKADNSLGEAFSREVTVGNNSYSADFNSKIIGKQIGDEFEAILSEKEDNSTKISARIIIDEVYKNIYPEINDQFAVDAGYENLAFLKEEIRSEIEKSNNIANKSSRKDAVLNAIILNNPFDVPFSFVAETAKHEIEKYQKPSRKLPEEFEKLIYANSVFEVKKYFVINELMRIIDVEITSEAEESFIREMASNLSITTERYKELYNDTIKSDDFKDALQEHLVLEKVMNTCKFIEAKDVSENPEIDYTVYENADTEN